MLAVPTEEQIPVPVQADVVPIELHLGYFVGFFQVLGGRFHLKEWFEPYDPEWIMAHTDADLVIDDDSSACKDL